MKVHTESPRKIRAQLPKDSSPFFFMQIKPVMLVPREVFRLAPPKVKYSLTPFGDKPIPVLQHFADKLYFFLCSLTNRGAALSTPSVVHSANATDRISE